MKNLISKLVFFFKKPKIIVLVDDNRQILGKYISRILGSFFKLEKEVLFVSDLGKADLSDKKYLILNFDEGNIRKFKEKNELQIMTFGFKEGADFQATDLKINGDTNFKVSNRGNIVPIWLKGAVNRREIYSVLTAITIGSALGFNLVKISQALKET